MPSWSETLCGISGVRRSDHQLSTLSLSTLPFGLTYMPSWHTAVPGLLCVYCLYAASGTLAAMPHRGYFVVLRGLVTRLSRQCTDSWHLVSTCACCLHAEQLSCVVLHHCTFAMVSVVTAKVCCACALLACWSGQPETVPKWYTDLNPTHTFTIANMAKAFLTVTQFITCCQTVVCHIWATSLVWACLT